MRKLINIIISVVAFIAVSCNETATVDSILEKATNGEALECAEYQILADYLVDMSDKYGNFDGMNVLEMTQEEQKDLERIVAASIFVFQAPEGCIDENTLEFLFGCRSLDEAKDAVIEESERLEPELELLIENVESEGVIPEELINLEDELMLEEYGAGLLVD